MGRFNVHFHYQPTDWWMKGGHHDFYADFMDDVEDLVTNLGKLKSTLAVTVYVTATGQLIPGIGIWRYDRW